jgi:hypothetical protein
MRRGFRHLALKCAVLRKVGVCLQYSGTPTFRAASASDGVSPINRLTEGLTLNLLKIVVVPNTRRIEESKSVKSLELASVTEPLIQSARNKPRNCSVSLRYIFKKGNADVRSLSTPCRSHAYHPRSQSRRMAMGCWRSLRRGCSWVCHLGYERPDWWWPTWHHRSG